MGVFGFGYFLGVVRTYPPEFRPRLGGGGNAFGIGVYPELIEGSPARGVAKSRLRGDFLVE